MAAVGYTGYVGWEGSRQLVEGVQVVDAVVLGQGRPQLRAERLVGDVGDPEDGRAGLAQPLDV